MEHIRATGANYEKTRFPSVSTIPRHLYLLKVRHM